MSDSWENFVEKRDIQHKQPIRAHRVRTLLLVPAGYVGTERSLEWPMLARRCASPEQV